MSGITIQGVGAVSPAGWSATALAAALSAGKPLAESELAAPEPGESRRVRRVPDAGRPFAWARHPRLRRVSPISRFAAAAAIEALGDDGAGVGDGGLRLGIVYCVMAGCVNYSSRFYREVLLDPATASPLVFPETVFNAPASHLAALLGTTAINYSLVGDDSVFALGLATAAAWLEEGRVDGCLVIGAEECDWLTCHAMALFEPHSILSEGSGAIYLKRGADGVMLEAITQPQLYRPGVDRAAAAAAVGRELATLGRAGTLFDSSTRGEDLAAGCDGNEDAMAVVSVRQVAGNAFCAASAWQVVAAAQHLRSRAGGRALVSVTGCNQVAIGLSLQCA